MSEQQLAAIRGRISEIARQPGARLDTKWFVGRTGAELFRLTYRSWAEAGTIFETSRIEEMVAVVPVAVSAMREAREVRA